MGPVDIVRDRLARCRSVEDVAALKKRWRDLIVKALDADKPIAADVVADMDRAFTIRAGELPMAQPAAQATAQVAAQAFLQTLVDQFGDPGPVYDDPREFLRAYEDWLGKARSDNEREAIIHFNTDAVAAARALAPAAVLTETATLPGSSGRVDGRAAGGGGCDVVAIERGNTFADPSATSVGADAGGRCGRGVRAGGEAVTKKARLLMGPGQFEEGGNVQSAEPTPGSRHGGSRRVNSH